MPFPGSGLVATSTIGFPAAALPVSGGSRHRDWVYDDGSVVTTVPPDPLSVAVTRSGPASSSAQLELETTADLLERARRGDSLAIDELFSRSMPALRRWARGRLPAGARDLLQTEDLVQDAVHGVLRHLNTFEPRHPGALQAYLREAVMNRIRSEARRLATRPAVVELEDRHADDGRSPLEQAMDRDDLARYEAALARLRPLDREAVIARLEMQSSYDEIARSLGKPNANAARSLVVRALYKLYEEMGHDA
ncbi:MAG TPA: sigma-70 family RNA polymerase sigma factor [Vicinamibacterales bacterium]|jgi:RNA polymerase sigma-70 factor (ECF subfamily)|nr:sigma-70 family RNA polymerase sigma factor [Vicinamibacterales bacterium]